MREQSFELFSEVAPFRWHDQSPSPHSPTPYYVGNSYYYGSEYSAGSPRTPLSARFITIQPRSNEGDLRDSRMFTPITKKRKGNNKYGQSGSHRCLRCQKGKRKCVYNSKNEPCQRCTERGFSDCGEKLPTPRKLAAMRQLQDSGYLSRDSDDIPSRSSSTDDYPMRTPSADLPLLPPLRLENLAPLKDVSLCKLWHNLTIWN